MSDEHLQYLRDQRAAGHSDDAIKIALRSAEYTDEQIDELFAEADKADKKVPPPIAPSPKVTPVSSRADALEQLGLSSDADVGESKILSDTPVRSGMSSAVTTILFIALLLAALIGGGVYVAMNNMISVSALTGLFSSQPYSQATIASEISNGLGTITTARTDVSISISTSPQDEDVYPIPTELLEADEDLSATFDSLAEFGEMVPPDFSGSLAIGGNFETSEDGLPQGQLQVQGEVDSDGLSFAIDLEMLVLATGEVFGRINRAPTLFFDFTAIKGKWVAFDADEDFNFDVAEAEGDQDELKEFGMEMLASMDRHQVLQIVEGGTQVELNGESLYEYRLAINPDTVTQFYREFMDIAVEKGYITAEDLNELERQLLRFGDRRYVEYYNTHFPIYVWARADGMPVQFQIASRIVLNPEDVPPLAGRQINVPITVALSDINVPTNFTAPEDAVPMEEAMEAMGMGGMFGALDDARTKGNDAAIKSTLNSHRAQAELYWDDNGGSYYGFCESDRATFDSLDSQVMCGYTADVYAISAEVSDGYYCVDSTGNAVTALIMHDKETLTCPEFIDVPDFDDDLFPANELQSSNDVGSASGTPLSTTTEALTQDAQISNEAQSYELMQYLYEHLFQSN